MLITPDKQDPKTQILSNILKYKGMLKWDGGGAHQNCFPFSVTVMYSLV